MLRKSTSLFVASLLAAVASSGEGIAENHHLPTEARVAVKMVASAAGAKNWSALRAMMVSRFTWSFGDEESADGAIAAWKTDPRYLRELQKVLAEGCRMSDSEHVECPGRGGTAFRAGFVRHGDQWRMEYFVEGD